MSVGHVARLLEEAGIPTVIIASQVFSKQLEAMKLPRVLITPYLMGRPIGKPNDKEAQLKVLQKGLDLFEKAEKSGTIKSL
ncbi:MAG: hypothetical protein GY707_02170 [Desulfobacteraceae bacterium]|nr:hypothetical protein [Desulfobacteraceae bacterium]